MISALKPANVRTRRMALGALCLVFAGCAAYSAQAQMKIGVVDMNRVMSRSTSISSTVDQANSRVQAKIDDLEARERALTERRRRLSQRVAVMSEPEIEKERAAIQTETDALRDLNHEVNMEMERIRREIMDPEATRMMEAVNAVAAAEGFDLILPRDQVLFVKETHDVTPLVIQQLDRSGAPAADGAAAPVPALSTPRKPAVDGDRTDKAPRTAP